MPMFCALKCFKYCFSPLLPLGTSAGVSGAGRNKQSHRGCSHSQAAITAHKGTLVALFRIKLLWHENKNLINMVKNVLMLC